jgi:hypothetical protein
MGLKEEDLKRIEILCTCNNKYYDLYRSPSEGSTIQVMMGDT